MKFRGTCLSLTKLADIENSIGLDRLATWNEVRFAMSFSSQGAFALLGSRNDSSEVDSNFSGSASNVPEDDMWLAIVSKMPETKSN